MSTWFFHPGSVLTNWLKLLLGGGKVHGLEHVPRTGPYLLVANHCSNLDPPFIGAAVGHSTGRVIHFMAKEEIRHWPLVGWLGRSAGVFFVRRGESDRAAQRQALTHLAEGRPIAIFPEGTRSRICVLGQAKLGAALIAMRAGVPLLPVGVTGTGRIFPGRSRFPHRTAVTIRIGPVFGLPHQADGRLDREALEAGTERIMREIAALLPEEHRGRYGTGPIESGG